MKRIFYLLVFLAIGGIAAGQQLGTTGVPFYMKGKTDFAYPIKLRDTITLAPADTNLLAFKAGRLYYSYKNGSIASWGLVGSGTLAGDTVYFKNGPGSTAMDTLVRQVDDTTFLFKSVGTDLPDAYRDKGDDSIKWKISEYVLDEIAAIPDASRTVRGLINPGASSSSAQNLGVGKKQVGSLQVGGAQLGEGEGGPVIKGVVEIYSDGSFDDAGASQFIMYNPNGADAFKIKANTNQIDITGGSANSTILVNTGGSAILLPGSGYTGGPFLGKINYLWEPGEGVDANFTGTAGISIPIGTSAERSTGNIGGGYFIGQTMRGNSTDNSIDGFTSAGNYFRQLAPALLFDSTTNATPITLDFDVSGSYSVSDDISGFFTVSVVGRDYTTATGDAIKGKKIIAFKKVSGTLTLEGSATDILATTATGGLSTATWSISASGGNLRATLTGVSAKNIRWVVSCLTEGF